MHKLKANLKIMFAFFSIFKNLHCTIECIKLLFHKYRMSVNNQKIERGDRDLAKTRKMQIDLFLQRFSARSSSRSRCFSHCFVQTWWTQPFNNFC